MRTITSEEVNFLIYRYLLESGFKHAAFTFGYESQIQSSNFNGSDVPAGSLISFLQKGVQYMEIETKLKNKEKGGSMDGELKYNSPFELLHPELKTKLVLNQHTRNSGNRVRSNSYATNEKITAATPSSATTPTTTTSTSHPTSSSSSSRDEQSQQSTSSQQGSNNNHVANTPHTVNRKNKGREGNKRKDDPSSSSSTTTPTLSTQSSSSQPNATTTSSSDSDAMQQDDDEQDEESVKLIPQDQATVLKGHTHEVFICAWSPTSSSVLASGSGDSTARIWSLPPGQCGSNMTSLASSNPIVLSHSSSEMISPAGSSKDVTTLDWSGDGSMLATGSYDGKARIWNSEGSLLCTLDKHKGPIFSLKWNKKGDYLLSGSVDNTAIIWDVSNGEVKQQFRNHTAPTLDVDWRNDVSFATCSTDKMIYVCKLGDQRPMRVFQGHEDEVNAIRWDPSGNLLASCSDDFTAKIWSMKHDQCLHDFREHTKEIYTIKWSPTGQGTRYSNSDVVLASASFDATIKIWDVNVGKCLYSLIKHKDPVYSVAFSPNGEYLASGSYDRSLHIWSVKDGKLIKTFHGNGSIFEVCWNSAGDKVAACFSDSYTEDFTVCVLDFRV
ncbi:transducin (beta)-like 1 [Acrasis kona]|uniref:Transducin (Beta)-like 1 n=1 Tax=Acrasis kona TaxID=1008807 RepID=A0AAW2YWK4_9EUKA